MLRASKYVLAVSLLGALAGCANQQRTANHGRISQSETMMEEAAAMFSAPNFNEGLARQIAVRQRNQRINAQIGPQ